MTKGPHPKVLNPDEALVIARPMIDLATPVLRTLVDEATWVILRCQAVPDKRGEIDEDIAPTVLYRHIVESTDAIEVLVSKSCCLPCIPLLRSAFEAALGLEYILGDKYAERSLAWLCGYVNRRLQLYRLTSTHMQSGVATKKAWEDQFGAGSFPDLDPSTGIANLEAHLRQPHMQPIEAEFHRLKSERSGRYPEWYSLFDGPGNLERLAREVKREAEYAVLYRSWSAVAHGIDLSSYSAPSSGGKLAFRMIRGPELLHTVAVNVTVNLLRATRLMINYYRRGEPFERWYARVLATPFRRLFNTRFNLKYREG